jgi:hypothetical protein
VLHLGASSALADTVVITSSKDNSLYEDPNGASSNGAGQYIFVGRNNGFILTLRRGLIAFDVAGSIPAGSTIERVRLVLHMSRTSGGPARVELHRASADWGQGASDAGERGGDGAPATPGDATWQHRFFNTDFWVNDGGDFAAAASASIDVAAEGFYSWESPEMAADVQAWLDDPAQNFGWLLRGDESRTNTAKRFDSRENVAADRRPQLEVEFRRAGPPVPLASSWGLVIFSLALFCGACALLRRARALSLRGSR